jgi:predicted transcriptional regulator
VPLGVAAAAAEAYNLRQKRAFSARSLVESTMNEKDAVRLSLTVSPELNQKLEQLADSSRTTKSEILRKAIALFDVVAEAKQEHRRFGILDQNRQLVTEIVGI